MSFYIVCTRKGVISNNTVYSQKVWSHKMQLFKISRPFEKRIDGSSTVLDKHLHDT